MTDHPDMRWTRARGILAGVEETHMQREADAAQRLLDAVERLTGERAGHLHQRDTGAVYTRMAELIERAADERVGVIAEMAELLATWTLLNDDDKRDAVNRTMLHLANGQNRR